MMPDSNPSLPPDPSASALLALPVSPDCSIEDCEQQVRRILDSPLFSGSRRLSEFLSFSTRAAMDGRTEIDQYEVAAEVLNRAEDFNPLDDASVRKLASQVRAKLEEYYQGEGATDPILVSLPRRSYVLRFRANADAQPPASEAVLAEDLEHEGRIPLAHPTAQPPAPVEDSADLALTSRSQSEDSPGGDPTVKPHGQVSDSFLPTSQGSQWARPGGLWIIGLVMIAMLAGAAIYQGLLSLWAQFPAAVTANADAKPGEFQILSQTGDLRGEGGEFSQGAALLGPAMDIDGDASVRMQFLPEIAAQHGGLMIVQDADNYVRFGSHFKVRSMLEFGHEVNGVYSMPESSYEFDPLAQSGLPLWLSIRKQAAKFTAFSSRDGHHWERIDSEQSLDPPLTNPVAGLYAFNGLTNSPELTARFRDLGVGLRFHHRPEGPVQPKDFPGWRIRTGCKDPNLISVRDRALELQFPDDKLCTNVFERSWEAPAGRPWYIEAYLNFQAINGSSAGIVLEAENSTVRLVRRDLNGASIMLERNLDRDVHMPDFPGAPPIYLRLTAQDGYLTGSFSRDGEHYRSTPTRIPLAELGSIRSYGLEAGLSHWLQVGRRPPARLISIEHGLLALEPMKPQPAPQENSAGVAVSGR